MAYSGAEPYVQVQLMDEKSLRKMLNTFEKKVCGVAQHCMRQQLGRQVQLAAASTSPRVIFRELCCSAHNWPYTSPSATKLAAPKARQCGQL